MRPRIETPLLVLRKREGRGDALRSKVVSIMPTGARSTLCRTLGDHRQTLPKPALLHVDNQKLRGRHLQLRPSRKEVAHKDAPPSLVEKKGAGRSGSNRGNQAQHKGTQTPEALSDNRSRVASTRPRTARLRLVSSRRKQARTHSHKRAVETESNGSSERASRAMEPLPWTFLDQSRSAASGQWARKVSKKLLAKC